MCVRNATSVQVVYFASVVMFDYQGIIERVLKHGLMFCSLLVTVGWILKIDNKPSDICEYPNICA